MIFFFNCKRQWQVEILVCRHPWLFCFSCTRRQQVEILARHRLWLFCFSCRNQQWTYQFIVIFYISFFSYRRWWWVERLVVISWFFFSNAEDNDKPRSRFAIILGCFASVGENDNKLPNSLLFCFGCRRRQQTSRLIVVLLQLRKMTICLPTHCCFLHFFLQVKKTMTSWKVHHHLLVFFIRCKIWQWTNISTHHYPWLFCFNFRRWQ